MFSSETAQRETKNVLISDRDAGGGEGRKKNEEERKRNGREKFLHLHLRTFYDNQFYFSYAVYKRKIKNFLYSLSVDRGATTIG